MLLLLSVAVVVRAGAKQDDFVAVVRTGDKVLLLLSALEKSKMFLSFFLRDQSKMLLLSMQEQSRGG